MADTKISELTAASVPLAGTEVLPIVQSGTTKKVAVSDLTAGRNVSMANLTTTGNTILGDAQADTLNVGNGDIIKNSTGFVGIGVTPASWDRGKGIDFKSAGNAVWSNGAGEIIYTANAYYNAGWKYGVTGGYAARYVCGNTNGTHIFSVSNNVAGVAGDPITWVDSLTLGATGNVTFNVGNLVQGTAAKGINFTANSAAAGKTSQLLNWYEEGTWTPSLGGTATYTTQIGRYTRVGNMVTVWAQIEVNTIGTGDKRVISGLPFTAANLTVEGIGNVGYCVGLATAVASCVPQVGANTTTIAFMNRTGAGTGTSAVDLFQNGARMYFTVSYMAA